MKITLGLLATVLAFSSPALATTFDPEMTCLKNLGVWLKPHVSSGGMSGIYEKTTDELTFVRAQGKVKQKNVEGYFVMNRRAIYFVPRAPEIKKKDRGGKPYRILTRFTVPDPQATGSSKTFGILPKWTYDGKEHSEEIITFRAITESIMDMRSQRVLGEVSEQGESSANDVLGTPEAKGAVLAIFEDHLSVIEKRFAGYKYIDEGKFHSVPRPNITLAQEQSEMMAMSNMEVYRSRGKTQAALLAEIQTSISHHDTCKSKITDSAVKSRIQASIDKLNGLLREIRGKNPAVGSGTSSSSGALKP